MNKKILAGIFAVAAMAGIGFAFYGFGEAPALPPGTDNETVNGHMEACRAYFESEEASALRDEMRDAIEAGDEEKAAELREEMKEGMPEGCRPPMRGGPGMPGRIIGSLPEDVQEEFKTAMENQDFEALKALREEYFPERGGCHCSCEAAE